MEKKNTHIVYGFITGVVMVITSIILYMTNLSFRPDMKYLSYLPIIPFLIGMIMNGIAFSKAHDGYVTFGNVFASCFKGAMIVALVMVTWSVISMFAFPEMKEKAMALAHDEMAKQQKLTDEQMDTSMNIMKKYWNAMIIASSIFGTLFNGAIFSLIAAAIAKKKGARPFTTDTF